MKNIKNNTKIIPILSASIMLVISFFMIIASEKCDNSLLNINKYSNKPISKDGFYFDTYISISIFDCKENQSSSRLSQDDYLVLLDSCFEICKKYQDICDPNSSSSELFKVNNNPNYKNGYEVNISTELSDLLSKTIDYSIPFYNKYNVLSGDLCNLWDYKNKTIPTDIEIENSLNILNTHSLLIKSDSIQATEFDSDSQKFIIKPGHFISEAPSITLGASAKGYIADKIADYLRTMHIKEAIIDLGGNVLVLGDKYDNSMYKVGIKKPFSESGEISVVCKLADKTVVTSGIYERYFKKDEQIFHHIIDATTGYPASNHINSVTIIADSSFMADCYSTGCLLYSVDSILEIIDNTPNVEAIIIDSDYNIVLSSGLIYDIDNNIVLK